MQWLHYAQKAASITLSAATTLSMATLSVIGMLAISPNLIWAIPTFVFAIAYEGQENNESIRMALRRAWTKDYLKHGVMRDYLKERMAEFDANIVAVQENHFLREYRQQLKNLKQFEEVHHLTSQQKEEKKKILKTLRKMERFLLQHIQANELPNPRTAMEKAAQQLLQHDRVRLQQQIQQKERLIKVSWVFSIGGGICCGLASLSAMQAGVYTFAFLSVIPGGVFVALAALTAIGYTFMLYQTAADIIQGMKHWARDFLQGPENESKIKRYARYFAIALAIGLAIFATVATAGTWWTAAKHGGTLLKLGANIAAGIRTVTILLMTLPSLIFSISNSITAINRIWQTHYVTLLREKWHAINAESDKETRWQRFNIFRLIANIIDYSAQVIGLTWHFFTDGLVGDQLPGVPANVSAPLSAASDVLPHLNYMPGGDDNHHHHASFLLQLAMLPVTITVGLIRIFAVGWDFLSTWDLTTSYHNIFGQHEDHAEQSIAIEPTSTEWQQQDLIMTCESIQRRLRYQAPSKAAAASNAEELITRSPHRLTESEKENLKIITQPLAEHRSLLWHPAHTRSEKLFHDALENYSKEQQIKLRGG